MRRIFIIYTQQHNHPNFVCIVADQLYNIWDNVKFREIKRDLQIRLMERFAETDSYLPRRMGHA